MSPMASLGFGGSSGSGILATGGTISDSYWYNANIKLKQKCHLFTTGGSFTVTANPNNSYFEILLVGGGGSGGGGGYASGAYRWAGAGGTSGTFQYNSLSLSPGTYTVVVGGSTGDSQLKDASNNVLAYAWGGNAGSYGNYPNINVPTFPTTGIPMTGPADIGTYFALSMANIPASNAGNQTNERLRWQGLQTGLSDSWAMNAFALSSFCGVGAEGYLPAFSNTVYNSGNGAGSSATANSAGLSGGGYGCGGSGGNYVTTNNSYTSGGAGSAGFVMIRYAK